MCISLHGCIRNTPSDTEVLAEHQLTGIPDHQERIQTHAKLGRMKELWGKQDC